MTARSPSQVFHEKRIGADRNPKPGERGEQHGKNRIHIKLQVIEQARCSYRYRLEEQDRFEERVE